MATLLLAEHSNNALDAQTAHALSAAIALGAEVDILVAGSDCSGAAKEASTLAGVRKILIADDTADAHHSAEALGALLVPLMVDYDALVAPATSTGKNVLPRVAALLDVMQISDIIAVQGHDTFVRPTYAGNAIETVQTKDAKRVVTVRGVAFAAASGGGSAPIEAVTVATTTGPVKHIGLSANTGDRIELSSARVVVSGGRAFGSKEKFDELLVPLAAKLNAAIGASRAAVDAGYASNDMQVGQTGKVVAPDLYIAAGISGAIQHLAGMKDAKVIVAINSDPAAPIFAVADYGLVGDIFTLLPELTAKL
ncbi:MAG: electron transfer flavoprotein subunit alpha/FixB family protein [Devosia sp.]